MSDNNNISRAKLRYIRVSPQKARLVADIVRGKDVDEALRILKFTRKKSAPIIGKLISSAMANATVTDPGVDVDQLFVKTIYVDGGPTLRRFLPRAHGRATRIIKRTSHITVELGSRA
jgi:large subunit ribosomal protein L22